jgi:hypothetical protein
MMTEMSSGATGALKAKITLLTAASSVSESSRSTWPCADNRKLATSTQVWMPAQCQLTQN